MTNMKINLNDVNEDILTIKIFTRTARMLLSMPGTVVNMPDDGIDTLELIDHLDAKIDKEIKDSIERNNFVRADD